MNQHDKDIENAVLGALLIEPEKLPSVLPILQDVFFFERNNQIIFKCMRTMYEKKDHIDILTVTQALRAIGRLDDVGGAYYISSLTNRIASTMYIESHIRKMHEFFILREITKLSNLLQAKSVAVGADCFELIEEALKVLNELNTVTSTKIRTVGEIFADLVSEIQKVQESGKPLGVPSGLDNLDRHTGGWQAGTLIILAARPGMGKTATALKLAKYPAFELKKPTAIFSLEMTATQLVGRIGASESRISSSDINQKKIDRKQLQDLGGRCHKLFDAPLYIDDTPVMKFSTLRAKAQRLVHDHDVELIIIDYLQLMAGDEKGNREQEISYISRNLKALSKELNIPIIALSQLSRQVENRPDKRPQLSDLRESGAIEQDADMVAFLFRPEYYSDLAINDTGYDYKGNILPTTNLLILDIAKGRELKTGELMLKFYGEFMIVDNYDLERPAITSSGPMAPNNDFLKRNDIEELPY